MATINIVPDYFCHGVAAEIIYEKLDIKRKSLITNKYLYLLGAQGGDIFFAYTLKPAGGNLGSALHKKNAIYLFEQLILGNLSYTAGFATHYALDCTLHPEVYAYENTKRSPFAHTSFEKDLGLFFSRKFGMRRSILPKEKMLACTGPIYDTVRRIEPDITLSGVERCLKRYFAYTRYKYLTKKQEYICDYDFAGLSESVDQAIEFGLIAVKSILDSKVDPEIFNKDFLSKKD